MAMNSPSSKVPSHGTHGYGQTFAVDLILRPAMNRSLGQKVPGSGNRVAFPPSASHFSRQRQPWSPGWSTGPGTIAAERGLWQSFIFMPNQLCVISSAPSACSATTLCCGWQMAHISCSPTYAEGYPGQFSLAVFLKIFQLMTGADARSD